MEEDRRIPYGTRWRLLDEKKVSKGSVIMDSSKLVKRAAAVGQPYLPPEIISHHVFVLLPVRILLKLCCVSKQWHALITDPIFRASYRSRSKQNPRLLLRYCDNVSNHFGFSSLDYKDSKIEPVSRFKNNKEYLFAVCLDLVCLYDQRRMYIWNPATGEHIKLPKYRTRSDPACYRQDVAFGYYLADSAEKYKLLHIRNNFPDNPYCEVFTLGSEQWKETKEPPFGCHQNTVMTCFNGAAHLLRKDRSIARFDLEREEWTLIEGPKPEDLSVSPWSTLKLTELDGLLCLSDYDMSVGTTIWFLEDYSKGIWVSKYNIDLSPVWTAGLHKKVVPLVLEKDGRLLIYICGTNNLYYYEPRTENFKMTYFYAGSYPSSVHLYIESFKILKF